MSRKPCCNGEGLKKGAWTIEEDKKLITYIQEHGEGGWRDIPGKAGLKRCGKSCRLRWTNYLKPDIRRGEFSAEEEQIIMMLHASRGNKWSIIARHLPKRTDNEIKNYWNTHLKRRLMEQGIDPATHKPLITSNLTPATPSTSLSPENSNSDNYQDAPDAVDEQSPPPPSSSSSKKTSSSSISNLLNRMATRVTSINKGILSASMEGGSISSTAASSPYTWDINNTNNNGVQDHESHVSMSTDDTDPFFSQSSWYPDQGVAFSEFLEEFGQDMDGFYERDRLMSDLFSSSTSVEEDMIMSRMDGWSDYLLEQPNYDFMGIQSTPVGGDGGD